MTTVGRLSPAVIDIVLNSVFRGDRGDKEAIARGRARLAELAPILEAGLDGRAFLAGDTPSIADLSVGSNITQLGLADAAPTTPNIDAWYRRVFRIEGFGASLPRG